jgi:hypothetical protein
MLSLDTAIEQLQQMFTAKNAIENNFPRTVVRLRGNEGTTALAIGYPLTQYQRSGKQLRKPWSFVSLSLQCRQPSDRIGAYLGLKRCV